jgi:putative ABC transport system ATP-binding protein
MEKWFGDGDARIHVLKSVDLDVASGSMTFLVGPSGCGKTTLISAMTGLLTPDSGSVEVFGTAITALHGRELTELRGRITGFIFQQFNLLPALDAVENAAVPLLILGRTQQEANHRARALLERLGMAPHLRKFPAQLSGGQQQRVAIARALIHEPRVVVCDEPTASLDAEAGHAVMELLREIAVAPERAVVVVTHDTRIFGFADRIAHMSDGEIVKLDEHPGKAD